jgi:hypothetical protein
MREYATKNSRATVKIGWEMARHWNKIQELS